ncbi:hypothetical protein ACEQPO_02945 [Bacillus sp. SL00103]
MHTSSSSSPAKRRAGEAASSVSITFSEGIESGFHAIKVLNAKGDRGSRRYGH